MIVNGLVITMLAVETVSDIRTKTVSMLRIMFFIIIGAVVNIFIYYQSIQSVLGGMAVGGIIMLYALLSKQSIGYGDALIFICTGLYVGLSKNLRILFFSLIAASLAGGIYALVKKKDIKTEIPFVPCILGTYIFMTCIEVFL